MKKTIIHKFSQFVPLFVLAISSIGANTELLTDTVLAAEVTWSDWANLDDKAQRGIDWRTAQGDAQDADGVFLWNYQFRNRYPRKMRFQSTLTYEDKNGLNQTETKVWVLGPDEKDGSTLIAKKLGDVEISKPEVVTAIDTGQPQVDTTQKEATAKDAKTREESAIEKETLGAPPPESPAAPAAIPLTPPTPKPHNPEPSNARTSEPMRNLTSTIWRLLPQAPITAHNNPVGSLTFSPDGTIVASGSWRQGNGTQVGDIILRAAPSGHTLRRMEGRWETPWNGKGPKPPWVGHWGKINSISFSPNGATLVSGGEDGRVMLWDAKSGRALRALQKVERPVISLSWVSPGIICGLSRDGKVTTWNVADKGVKSLTLGASQSGDWVRVGVFSPDGQRLAIGDASGGLTMWNLRGGTLVRKVNNSRYQDIAQPQGVEITALAFSPDGKLLLSANHAHIYRNSVEKSPDLPDHSASLLFAGQRVRQIVFAPDGQTAAAVGQSKVLIVNPLAKTAAEARLGELPTVAGSILELAVSPRQTALATGGTEGQVVLWK